ncbi:MAG: nucleotidyl transferase AbiEii/AbiGii toxin family protein [Candidatus Omnitrophica bacterium]|nr:nucleotidyl transferase AbiEii/AbiGii toxin family protein [Candidatus Omnitrophota bacterium]
MKIDFFIPKKVLPFLQDRLNDFYLAGGTALSMFYYEHRESFDLDFFTKKFSKERIFKIVTNLSNDSKWKVELISEQDKDNLIRMGVYMVQIDQETQCKIDFVEDYMELLNPLKQIDGIKVLSLEDIYLRKIYAIAGHIPMINEIGQEIMFGGRQTAKDFYDIYCLSTITMPLSEFVSQHCSNATKEGVVHWYRTYDRTDMKVDLLGLLTKTKPDFQLMENHFKKEINQLLKSLIEGK